MANWLRKNAGIIVTVIGFVLLVILTYGDLGELFTEKYWENVGGNITSIGSLTIGLVLIQVAIKQGISEQALSKGLNTDNTKQKYKEHKELITKCQGKQIYLSYFLSIRNERETKRRRREFLVDNNFKSEKELYLSKKKNFIRRYRKIQTNLTVDSIKWSTTDIIYNKQGRIEKLNKYRKKRTRRAIVMGFVCMFATTLIVGGLFLDPHEVPFWQKTIKLFTYIITIVMSVVFDIGKNYEKGAFGVPNELEEVNGIWEEFFSWQVPQWVVEEVEKEGVEIMQNEENEGNQSEDSLLILDTFTGKALVQEEDKDEIRESEEKLDTGTTLQEESEKIEYM